MDRTDQSSIERLHVLQRVDLVSDLLKQEQLPVSPPQRGGPQSNLLLQLLLVAPVLLLQLLPLAQQPAVRDRPIDDAKEVDIADWLHQVVVCSKPKSVDRRVDTGLAGNQHYRHVWVMLPGPVEQVDAGGICHADIGQEHVGRLRPQDILRFTGRGRSQHAVSRVVEPVCEELADG